MTEPIRIQAEGAVVEPGGGETIVVPSGQEISLLDVIWNEPGPTGMVTRFRFLAPGIARDAATVSFDVASADMAHLCQDYALPRVSGSVMALGADHHILVRPRGALWAVRPRRHPVF